MSLSLHVLARRPSLLGSTSLSTPPAPPTREEHLERMYALALKNTDEQLRWMPDGTAFVKTGDIPAEWLRDSSAQVRPWLFDAPRDPEARRKLRAVIQRQAICLKTDPYANAFREDYSIWERKFEIDSLAYPMLLAWTYWKQTGDTRVFTREVHDGFAAALATLRLEQDHDGSQPGRPRSTYTFKSDTEEAGKNPVSYTGMIWCGFRPSDDVCTYNYLIPSQMQVVQALTALDEIYRDVYHDTSLAKEAASLRDEVRAGIERYGTIDDPTFGRRYVYETDGRGNSLSMDDANLPSLMSAPYFGYVSIDDPIYQNTRRFALSKANPFYFEGRYARGIGSPHIPKPWVWPLDLEAEALTTRSSREQRTLVDYLLASDPGDSRLHESFDPNDPKQYTRPDFGWPNALFVELVRLTRGERPLPTPAPAAIADTARLTAARPVKAASTPQSVVLRSGDTELRIGASGVIEGIGPATAAGGEGNAVFRYQDRRSGLKGVIRYEKVGDTGVFKRTGTIELPRAGNYVIPSSLELMLPGGDYELTHLWGGSGQEWQVATEPLRDGQRRFVSDRGRAARYYEPFMLLHDEKRDLNIAAQLEWGANWQMSFERRPGNWHDRLRGQPLSVSMAMRADDGEVITTTGPKTVELPAAVLTAAAGDRTVALNRLHRYQEQVAPRAAINTPPLVVYNTWYAYNDNVKADELVKAVDAAAELGAEVFIIDAGWFVKHSWWDEVGDWQVNPERFPHGLREIADRAKQRGMRFGIWVELEAAGAKSTVLREHPDWCMQKDGKPALFEQGARAVLNFAKPEVRAYAMAVIDRLVGEGADWVKLDANTNVTPDIDSDDGLVLYAHTRGYCEFLDDVRAKYPQLVLENCASGALRPLQQHTHVAWASDRVDPKSTPSLTYGRLLAYAPRLFQHWMATDEKTLKQDGGDARGWLDFAFRAGMQGQWGLSARLEDWSPQMREAARANIALYKSLRPIFEGADTHVLTPPVDLDDPKGWMAVQHVQPQRRGGSGASVVFAYRLADSPESATFTLRDVPADAVITASDPEAHVVRYGDTITVSLPAAWRSTVLKITPRS